MFSFTSMSFNNIPREQDIFLFNDEIHRSQSMNPHQKALFIKGRWLIRNVLSKLLNTSVEHLPLQYQTMGKPFLANFPVEFNLSHCQDQLCFVTHDKPIGIDIQYHYKKKNIPSLFNYIKNKDDDLQGFCLEKKFYFLWSLKEAYAKKNGISLLRTLKNVSFQYKNNLLKSSCKKTSFVHAYLKDQSYGICLALEEKNLFPILCILQNNPLISTQAHTLDE